MLSVAALLAFSASSMEPSMASFACSNTAQDQTCRSAACPQPYLHSCNDCRHAMSHRKGSLTTRCLAPTVTKLACECRAVKQCGWCHHSIYMQSQMEHTWEKLVLCLSRGIFRGVQGLICCFFFGTHGLADDVAGGSISGPTLCGTAADVGKSCCIPLATVTTCQIRTSVVFPS